MSDNASALLSHAFRRQIEHREIDTAFLPVVDLFAGRIMGYEAHSRGRPPFADPLDLFAQARREGWEWEADEACLSMALRRIAKLPSECLARNFFLNVTSAGFSSTNFLRFFTPAVMARYGLNSSQVVIELESVEPLVHQPWFPERLQELRARGFRLALDNFTAAGSCLDCLLRISPHFVKIDRKLVAQVRDSQHARTILTALDALAKVARFSLIAEGVEAWETLGELLRLGVGQAQGFLLAEPAAQPPDLLPEDRARLTELVGETVDPLAGTGLDESIRVIVNPATVLQIGTARGEDLDRIFRANHTLDHLVVAAGDKPRGLMTRKHFYAATSGQFGYSLLQKRPVETMIKPEPLIVNDQTSLTLLARLAMERTDEDLYDPVLVIDSSGRFLGTVTIKQLLHRASQLEVQTALGSNPLTNLPGNVMIQKWIGEALVQPDFTVIYADLDKFKEYNDQYGFMNGDEMIKLAAAVLNDAMPALGSAARLGHVGGDDFIIVVGGPVGDEPLSEIGVDFDRRKEVLFKPEDCRRGYYICANRKGEQVETQLVTLSLAVIDGRQFASPPHPALIAQVAAMIKKRAKRNTAENRRSGFLREQRRHDDPAVETDFTPPPPTTSFAESPE